MVALSVCPRLYSNEISAACQSCPVLSFLIDHIDKCTRIRPVLVKYQFWSYCKMGNFRVVQFSRNFAISINLQKLKSAKHFPIFETISVWELVAYTVAICGSYLFTCSKTSNMQLSKNGLSLQAIWLEVNLSVTHPIYSKSRSLIFICCCIWHTFNCFSFFIE